MKPRDNLTTLELMLLLILVRLKDEAYGIPIIRELEERTGRYASIGAVYASLQRLEEKGFVVSNVGEATSERGGRAKRYFRITAMGLKRLRETKKTLTDLWRNLPQLEGGTT